MIFDAERSPEEYSLTNEKVGSKGIANDVDLVKAAYRDFNTNDMMYSPEILLAENWQPIIDDINETTGSQFANPAKGFRNYELASKAIFKYIKDNEQQLPHLQGLTQEQLIKTTILQAQDARRAYEELLSTRPDNPILPGIIGAAGSVIQEPSILATLPLSFYSIGANTLRNVVLREAGLAGGTELYITEYVQDWYKTLGRDFDLVDRAKRVGLATVAGGALAGVFYSTGKAIGFTKDQAIKGIEAYKKSGLRLSKSQKSALEKAKVVDEEAALNPIEDALEHEARGREVKSALLTGDNVNLTSQPQSRPVEYKQNTGYVTEIDPEDLKVDAKLFQFKQGGDASGVTKRLREVEEWSPELSGETMVYEYANGEKFIVDGHQRLGLAKRLKKQDPKQDIKLSARILREVDGVTPEQAKIRAAVKNLAQGTGTPIDAAKIFKGKSPINFKTLPVGNKLIKDGMGLMKLSDDAFGAVINEMIPANYGAIIGRVLEKKPELHASAVEILSKNKPSNEFEAEAMVRQIEAGPMAQAVQGGLFGDEIVTNSLFKERAKILDGARKRLVRDKATFNTLVENAKRIESEGNQLQKKQNILRRDTDAQAIQVIQALANTRGSIADALNRAATRFAETGKYEDQVTDFVDAVREGIASGDLGRIQSSDVRYDVDVSTAQRPIEKTTAELEYDKYDEPYSDGFISDADQLERDMFGGADNPVEKPIRGADFDEAEQELFDQIPLDEEIPVGVRMDGDEEVVETMTLRQIKEEIDEDKKFLDVIGGCVK